MLIFHVDRLNETSFERNIHKVITSFSSAMALRNWRLKYMKADQSPEIIKMTQNNFFPNILVLIRNLKNIWFIERCGELMELFN